jgi:hypothetical protein
MRYIVIFIVSLALFMGFNAQGKRKYRGLPRTEVGLMNNVIGCLKYSDTLGYYNLFPPFDTLWMLVMHNPDRSPETIKAINNLKEHPQSLLEFDPNYNHRIIARFCDVITKGRDSGINWDQIVMQRYELNKEVISTKSLAGYDKIAPERFQGYIFVRDLLGRHTFCISITEIQKINGFFFGGQVLNILEASSPDEFRRREAEEQKYFEWLALHPIDEEALRDSLRNDSIKNGLIDTAISANDTTGRKKHNFLNINAQEDEKTQTRKEVIDRKYYEGTFDEEIPVKVYIRYMRDVKGNKVTYDGLYKFGDQEDYVKISITRNAEGKWIIDDETPLGSMELELKNKTYTGSWTNVENQTGYDVVLNQKDVAPKIIEQLDRVLESGHTGRVDDELVEEKGKKKKGKDDEEDEGKTDKHRVKDKVYKKMLKAQKKEQKKLRRKMQENE